LAALVSSVFNLQSPNYLSDNQALVTFFNGTDFSSPPDWRVKDFTNQFIKCNRGRQHNIFKIGRQLNTTAHLLAKQAHVSLSSNSSSGPSVICSNSSHQTVCPLTDALSVVNWEQFQLLTVRCC
jgi:hypothetical protein